MTNPHQEETFQALYKSDAQLKNLPVEKYGKLASADLIAKTKKALEEKKVNVHVVEKSADALALLKKLVPAGKTVMNAHSTSLEEIGFVEYLKTQKDWINLHDKIFAEADQSKHAALYKEAHKADYFFCSACAISQDGDIVAADMSGTKVGAFSFAAGNLVLVVGTQKIVKNYEEAVKRTEEYALALESARVRIAYKIPSSAINNFVAIRGPNPFNPNPRITVVFVKETLGY